jgi:hypothetical protein
LSWILLFTLSMVSDDSTSASLLAAVLPSLLPSVVVGTHQG